MENGQLEALVCLKEFLLFDVLLGLGEHLLRLFLLELRSHFGFRPGFLGGGAFGSFCFARSSKNADWMRKKASCSLALRYKTSL